MLSGRMALPLPLVQDINQGGPVTRYPFPDAPDNVNGWSMKTVTALPGVDRRTAQSQDR